MSNNLREGLCPTTGNRVVGELVRSGMLESTLRLDDGREVVVKTTSLRPADTVGAAAMA